MLRAENDDSGIYGLVRLRHPSMYDFLISQAAGRFRIDLSKQNHVLAFRCLTVMNSQLKFNICDINDSSLLNTEVEDLSQRIRDHIPEALRYSCRFFAHHLLRVHDLDGIVKDAWEEFVSKHLLHWIEAMSLLGQITEAERCLEMLAGWVKVRIGVFRLSHMFDLSCRILDLRTIKLGYLSTKPSHF